jgi:hypothetical protein
MHVHMCIFYLILDYVKYIVDMVLPIDLQWALST